ncbi:MAG: hypothetical protein ACI9E1_002351 [Cryomorphaceae bacterium]|jgi:hypothetical protein
MKKHLIIPLVCVLTIAVASIFYLQYQKVSSHNPYNLSNGDIVFQETRGSQGEAVKAATDSRWTHVGVVFYSDGKPMVIEAVQPVKITPLGRFISRSPKSFYAMRLKDADERITPEAISKAEKYGGRQLGKDYDLKFQWSDERIYCSELVWKIYQEAVGLELCEIRPFSTYNLDHPTVQRMIKQRYESMDNLPMNEPCVAPSDLAQSNFLVEVPKRK